MVRDADVALTGGDGLEDLGVAGDEGRVVRHPPAHDGLRARLAVPGDHGGEHRLVVDVRRGAQAQAVLPPGLAQGLVGRQLLGLDLPGAVHDGAGPDGEAEPAALGIPQVGRDAGHEIGRVHPRQQPGVGRLPEVAGVHGHQDVGGTLGPLGPQALEDLRGVAGQGLDLNAGLLGERGDGRLVAVVARRVHDDLRSLGARGNGAPWQQGGGGREDAASARHLDRRIMGTLLRGVVESRHLGVLARHGAPLGALTPG